MRPPSFQAKPKSSAWLASLISTLAWCSHVSQKLHLMNPIVPISTAPFFAMSSWFRQRGPKIFANILISGLVRPNHDFLLQDLSTSSNSLTKHPPSNRLLQTFQPLTPTDPSSSHQLPTTPWIHDTPVSASQNHGESCGAHKSTLHPWCSLHPSNEHTPASPTASPASCSA